MTFAAGFAEYDEYDEYMECLQNLVNGETFFIAMEQRNQVLMCERPVLWFCFLTPYFQTLDFFSGLVH